MSVSYTGLQWESTNAFLRHPFSESASMTSTSGAELPDDAVADAFLNPMFYAGPWWDGVEPGPPRLVKIDCGSGRIEFSFNGGRLSGTMSETGSARIVDEHGADCGVVVAGPGWSGLASASVSMEFDGIELSSSAFCPVAVPGVSSFSDESRSRSTRCTNVEFVGDGVIRPVLEKVRDSCIGDWRLRFDVYRQQEEETGIVRQLVVVCTGPTPFDISDMVEMDDGNAVFLSMPSIDKEDVCWNAHREDDVAVVADACKPIETCPPPTPEFKSRTIHVCPSEMTGAVEFVPGDTSDGYRNPIRISVVSGAPAERGVRKDPGTTNDELVRAASRLMEPAETHGNGIRISIPGTGVA